ncbi:MAG: hypothetical protein ACREUO_01655 [Burkholderiales bacterium]
MRCSTLRYAVEGRIARYAEEHGFHAAVAWRDSGKAIPEGRRKA